MNIESGTSIEYLRDEKIISMPSFHICLKQKMTTIDKILNYYTNNGSFTNLKHCGGKSNQELIDICVKFIEIHGLINEKTNSSLNTITRNYQNDMSLEDLSEVELMSVRAINICKDNGLITLANLIEFKKTYKSFSKLKNCGLKSEKQLDCICEKYRNYFSENLSDTRIASQLLETYDILTPFQRKILNSYFEYAFMKLHTRSRNALKIFFHSKFNAREVISTILQPYFDFYEINNIGETVIPELLNFKKDIHNFISNLESIQDCQLNEEYTKMIIKTNFKNLPQNLDVILKPAFTKTGGTKVFSLINILVNKDIIFKPHFKEVFIRSYYLNTSYSYESIAKHLGRTKERVRQIKIKFENEITTYFNFLGNIKLDEVNTYETNEQSNIKIINEELIHKINSLENVNFNNRFYNIILSTLHNDNFQPIGLYDLYSIKNILTNAKEFKNVYLIRKEFCSIFNFFDFINAINSALSDKIIETYSLHFEGYLSQFAKDEWKIFFHEIKDICECIILNEFELVITIDGYLVFGSNVKANLVNYIIDTLESIGNMTSIENLTTIIIRNHPDLNITQQSVRSALVREKNLFIYIGRTSTYGLKKWEKENNLLKGGTIRDLTVEYLSKFQEPKHIKDISTYVEKFRPNTYLRSILDNLKADKSGNFIFYGNGNIGFKLINYPSHFVVPEKRKLKSWNEKYALLKEFFESSHKWPSSQSDNKVERFLYQFIYKSRIAYKNNKLNVEQINMLKLLSVL